MEKRVTINGLFALILTAILLSLHKFFSGHWGTETLDEIFDIIGLSLICLGFLFRISGRGYKSERSNDGNRLVITGPYGFVRNPMYLGTVIIGVGIMLFLVKWWVVFIFITLFLIRFLPQIRKEEHLLNERFGNMYQLYCKRVPQLFPNIMVFLRRDIRKVLPIKYYWVKKEIVTIVVIFAATFIVELHEDVSHYGRIEYIKEPLLLINVLVCFILLFLFLQGRKENDIKIRISKKR